MLNATLVILLIDHGIDHHHHHGCVDRPRNGHRLLVIQLGLVVGLATRCPIIFNKKINSKLELFDDGMGRKNRALTDGWKPFSSAV